MGFAGPVPRTLGCKTRYEYSDSVCRLLEDCSAWASRRVDMAYNQSKQHLALQFMITIKTYNIAKGDVRNDRILVDTRIMPCIIIRLSSALTKFVYV